MTPADLMRAIVPVFPPSESDIVREGYLRGEHNPSELHCSASEFFMLFDTNSDGLISFPESVQLFCFFINRLISKDRNQIVPGNLNGVLCVPNEHLYCNRYILFVTLLSIPVSSFSVAFKMFDLDRNGEIELEEFKKVMALMQYNNRQGPTHRGGLRIGLKVGTTVENGGILEYFFGKNGTGCLQHEKFVQFLRDLHEEIICLEFSHYDYKARGTISAKDFALSMVASADINQIGKFLDRVDELNSLPHLNETRI